MWTLLVPSNSYRTFKAHIFYAPLQSTAIPCKITLNFEASLQVSFHKFKKLTQYSLQSDRNREERSFESKEANIQLFPMQLSLQNNPRRSNKADMIINYYSSRLIKLNQGVASYNLNESSTVDNLRVYRAFAKISHNFGSSVAAMLLSIAR